MSSFNPLSFAQIVENEVAAVEAASTALYNFNSGSVLNAILQTNAGNSLWLQSLVAFVISINRLATSTGTNVDTFIADFGFTRPAGTPASGSVTLSRYTPNVQAVIPASNTYPGSAAVVYSSALQVSYFVTIDPTNPDWSPSQNAYLVPINTSSITVPVQCTVVGTIGNAQISQINTIQSAIVGIDTVTNASAFSNGTNPASDSQTKAAFILYLQSLFRATQQALDYAISITPGVTRYSLVENATAPPAAAQSTPGAFYAVIDDGSGSPPSPLITAVHGNLANYRGFCIAYSVYAPTAVAVTIVVSVLTTGVETHAVVTANIKNALINYIEGLTFNVSLYYSRIAQICYDADPTVLDVFSYTLNGSTSDLVGNVYSVFTINTGAITVTVTP